MSTAPGAKKADGVQNPPSIKAGESLAAAVTASADAVTPVVDTVSNADSETVSNAGVPPEPTAGSSSFTKQADTDMPRHDYQCEGSDARNVCHFEVDTLEQAEAKCLEDPQCSAFVMTKDKHSGYYSVWLKNGIAERAADVTKFT